VCDAFRRKAPLNCILRAPQEHGYRKPEREVRADELGMHAPVRLLSALPSKSKCAGFGRGSRSPQRQNLWSTAEPLAQPSCSATQSESHPTMKMHLSHPHFIYKITVVLCYSGQFACCETTVINLKTISAAVIKCALPNICSRVVTSRFSSSGFTFFFRRVQSHFIASVVFRLRGFSVNPKGLPREKSLFCQISFQAKAQRHRLPLTWQGVFHGL